MHVITVIAKDESLVCQLRSTVDPTFHVQPYLLQNQTSVEIVQDVLGIHTGSIETEIVVFDLDSIGWEKERLSLLTHCIGAGIPTFINTHSIEIGAVWQMASLGAKPLTLERAQEEFELSLKEKKYNDLALKIENEFALCYDQKELSSSATLSAILWENEYVLTQVKDFLKQVSGSVRILDLGCGTGRFEEILFADPEINSRIEEVHAVDFAPMFLKMAKKRLSHFLPPSDRKRITFLRRIVEDSLLPSQHYDIVIASFGVVCFSKFYRTIPEIYRMVKEGGMALFNGYNRDAIAHDLAQRQRDRLFLTYIDKMNNEIHFDGNVMKCFAFNVEELRAFLSFIGFHPCPEKTQTFPTLHSCIQVKHLNLLRQKVAAGSDVAPSEYASYQNSHLSHDLFESGYSAVLHQIDVDLADIFKDKGFYFAMTARK